MNTLFKSIGKLVLLAFLLVSLTAGMAQAIETGTDAPDFTLKTHDGKSLTLSKLEGKRGVVLVFFATWCPSCMEEVPHVKKFVEESRDKNILVYGVNLQQPQKIVDKFVKSYDVNYRVLLDPGAVAKSYGVVGIPYVVGIDGTGKVIHADHVFPGNHEKFIKDLNNGLKDEKKGGDDKMNVTYITKEELQELRNSEKNLVVVDVLSPESYKKHHIEGAINIPLAQIEELSHKLPKDGVIVTYCANFKCKASTRAAERLQKLGFKKVYDYEGGIKDWLDNNLPVTKSE